MGAGPAAGIVTVARMSVSDMRVFASPPRGVACAHAGYGLRYLQPARDIRLTLIEAAPRILPQLKERINGLIAQGNSNLVVDLEGVEFMDSTGLSALVSGLMRTSESGGGMTVVCTRPQVLRLLALTGLDQVLKVHSSVAEAVA